MVDEDPAPAATLKHGMDKDKPSKDRAIVACRLLFATVLVHALGVTPRPAAADFGSSMVRTYPPLVVISSTYSGLVFWFVPAVVHTYVLPVSSPMRTTARLPPVKGTGAVVGAGEVVREDVGVLVIEDVDVTVLVGVFVDVTVLLAVFVGVAVMDPVKLDDGEGVLELVEEVVSAGEGVVDGVVPGGREADAEAVLLAVDD